MLIFWFIVMMTITFFDKSASMKPESELAVAMSESINVIDRRGVLVFSHPIENGPVTALAYLPFRRELYFAISNHDNYSIFFMNPEMQISEHYPVVTKQSEGRVQSLTFDRDNITLYWTVANRIKYFKIGEKAKLSGTVLYSFTDYIPFGLTIDFCNSVLFWTNQYHPKNYFQHEINSVIEKYKMNGNNESVYQLFRTNGSAYGIMVDYSLNRVCWSEVEEGSHVNMKCLSENESISSYDLIVSGENGQKPTSLAKLDSHIFWTDEASRGVYSIDINEPTKISALKLNSEKSNAKIYGILALKSDKPPYCQGTKAMKKQNGNLSSGTHPEQLNPKYEEGKSFKVDHNKITKDLCYNYCLNEGICDLLGEKPRCGCKPRWEGKRCEIDSCAGYCYNNGTCYIENEDIRCNCSDGFSGHLCEHHAVMEKYTCVVYCSLMSINYDHNTVSDTLISQGISYIEHSSCRCSDYNIQKGTDKMVATAHDDDAIKSDCSTNILTGNQTRHSLTKKCTIDSWRSAMLIVLSVTSLSLMAFIAVLISLSKSNKSNFIIKKNGIPLLLRSQSQEQCDTTEENF